jgi:hypothetical protein
LRERAAPVWIAHDRPVFGWFPPMFSWSGQLKEAERHQFPELSGILRMKSHNWDLFPLFQGSRRRVRFLVTDESRSSRR